MEVQASIRTGHEPGGGWQQSSRRPCNSSELENQNPACCVELRYHNACCQGHCCRAAPTQAGGPTKWRQDCSGSLSTWVLLALLRGSLLSAGNKTTGYHFGGPSKKDSSIVGSILGSPILGDYIIIVGAPQQVHKSWACMFGGTGHPCCEGSRTRQRGTVFKLFRVLWSRSRV